MNENSGGGEIYRTIVNVSIALGVANAGGRMTLVLPGEGFDLLAAYMANVFSQGPAQASVVVFDLPTGRVHVTRAT